MHTENSHRAWVVCLTAALFFFYELIQMNMFGSINPDIMQAFSLNATQLGKFSVFYFYATVLFLLPAGQFLDRFSTRKIILFAMFLCISGTVIFAKATVFPIAAAARFMTGIGSAFCFLSSIRLASRWFPSQRMALVSGLIVMMGMLGGMVAQTPLTYLLEAVGWRQALIYDAGLGLVVFTLIFFVVQDFPSKEAAEVYKEEQAHPIGFINSMKMAYLKRQNWLAGMYTSLMNMPLALLGALWGSAYLHQVHHFSRDDGSYINSMLFLGTLIGGPIAGYISDRIGNRRKPMMIGTVLSFFTVLIIMYMPHMSFADGIILFFLLGFFASTQVIGYPVVAESNPNRLTAMSVSIVSFSAMAGYVIFQPLFGWLMDLHGRTGVVDHMALYSPESFRLALWIIPLGFIASFFAAVFIKESFVTEGSEEVSLAEPQSGKEEGAI